MNAFVKSLITAAVIASFSVNAMADDDERYAEQRDNRRDKYQQMQPFEREGMRQDMRNENDRMSPREREEMRHEMRERFEKMSPHERREMRQDMRHRGQHGRGRYYASSNVGGAHIVFSGDDGRLAIQRVEFMLGF
jgi:ATPase subunit of ABC transporter with duplicated ATPase domains